MPYQLVGHVGDSVMPAHNCKPGSIVSGCNPSGRGVGDVLQCTTCGKFWKAYASDSYLLWKKASRWTVRRAMKSRRSRDLNFNLIVDKSERR